MVDPAHVVAEWHTALERHDLDALEALVSADVELVGPRGESHGSAVVREWAERSGIALVPGRTYVRGDAVVVEQSARWPDRQGEPRDEQTVVTAFQVERGKITRIARFDSLAPALEYGGLDERDLRP